MPIRCGKIALRGVLAVLTAMILGVGLMACGDQETREEEGGAPPAGGETGCDTAAARNIVEAFGQRLKNVNLLAVDSIAAAEIRANYGDLVSEHLLDGWLFRPENAPGREASSPWPERIQVDTITDAGAGSCQVQGQIIYLTSQELTHGGVAAVQPVNMMVQRAAGGGWVITSYEVTTPMAPAEGETQAMSPEQNPQMAAPGAVGTDNTRDGGATPAAARADSATVAAAVDLVRRYYAAIDAGEFRRAYLLWGDGGKASGQSYEEFVAGFAETASVQVGVRTPGPVEGAAGSRFIEIPVVIEAVLEDGTRQRFEGTYTLRRAVVEGATPAEQRWHIYSARIRQTR